MSSPEPFTARYRQMLPWAVVGFLLVVIAIVYGQTLGFNFSGYDDPAYVFESRQVRGGLTTSGIVWAFTSGPFGEWYPLSMMSHMLDCQLFGLNAHWHHLTNVLLHAATAIGLFLVLRSMTGELWPSAFAATVFAVHPQHVESVAWIAERRDVLSGLFFVLTLAAYLGYVRLGRSVGRYLLVALCLTLGLMAKPMLITVPALLVVLDFWPLARFGQAADLPPGVVAIPRQSFASLVIEKLPLLAIALAAAAITMATHSKEAGAVSLPWLTRFASAVVALVTYLFQFFYPVDLAVFYPFPAAGYPFWQIAGAVVVLAAISEAATSWQRERPYVLVGWLWFVGMLVPVIGVVQVSHHAMADRYMYLSTIGLCVAVAWGVSRLARRFSAPRWVLGWGAAAVIALLTLGAARQTSFWGNDELLWRHALATTEDNGEAELALANALRRDDRLEEALEHYRQALTFQESLPLLTNMGIALVQLGQLEEATSQFRRAADLYPHSARAHITLAAALADQGEFDEAIAEYREALKLAPNDATARQELDKLLKAGRRSPLP
jgi:protein O-mannosyl-transferase